MGFGYGAELVGLDKIDMLLICCGVEPLAGSVERAGDSIPVTNHEQGVFRFLALFCDFVKVRV